MHRYALSLQDTALDQNMCNLPTDLGPNADTTELPCPATETLREAALAFCIISSIGLIPHLFSLYIRFSGQAADEHTRSNMGMLLTCVMLAQDMPQIAISAV